MRVGVPREIKPDEYRVGLTPTAVREYVSHGHEVIVEKGAGVGAGYPDDGLHQGRRQDRRRRRRRCSPAPS